MTPEATSETSICNNDAVFDRTSGSLSFGADVSVVSQVSPVRAKALCGMGISTVRDLLFNYPRRYIDLTKTSTIADAKVGESYTLFGTVYETKLKKPRPRLSLTEITVVDNSGTLIVTMFRMPWLAKQLSPGDRIAIAGAVEFNYGFKRMTNPILERLDGVDQAQARVIPVHPACEKISPAMMRRIIGNALVYAEAAPDPIPLDLRVRRNLMSRMRALNSVHFPHTLEEAGEARRRMAYEELLLLQLRLMMEGERRSLGKRATSHIINGEHQRVLQGALPFTLTEDQARAREDLNRMLSAPRCANHLMLGDVGTGKTIVAAFAVAAVADTGTQAVFMAPTEVLAQQHGKSLGPLFDAANITWEVLTGSTSSEDRSRILALAAGGVLDVLIGTHALLEDDVVFKDCSLVIIDEQQRFGVSQRKKLYAKGEAPDALYLTATPIPRTLALAMYGNLTLSYLHQRPRASQRITKVLAKSLQGKAYDAALAACQRGEQVYVVCPLIGAAPSNPEKKEEGTEEHYEYASISIEHDGDYEGANITAASEHAAFLQDKVFRGYRVGLLHGKLSSEEKAQVMDAFRAGDINVLVSTTVIEVGVDVPNATVMIVEDADRFGLSQLHQLRGRVGRGEKSAEVYLVSASKSDTALNRLHAMEATDDGMELATFDLSLRREGDILGNRQHGASSLKLVNIARDSALIEAAHEDAQSILDSDPELERPEHLLLSREIRQTFSDDTIAIGG